MLGVRLNSVNDTALGEPEQDANSALTELDKGLRSVKVGEQCEAIVRFPKLFEKYPFPILINSSFLKLADVFRMGNNFLRLWVLRVCQQSEKHLDKILNVDEFVRRVFSVLHSNDPVARALALKTLGAVAGIIPDRQNVHHAIRRGLDSHDNVEVDAAIYATTKFAAHSNAFAVSMCNKLSDMVECEATGAELRAKLVHALKSVHGGAVRANGVLQLLRSLLERFPSSSSMRATIAALTAIANDTVVHVPDTVELLLDVCSRDGRASVWRSCAFGLRVLATHAALWPTQCLARLVTVAQPQHDALYLKVMQKLVDCPAICASAGSLSSDDAVSIRQYCLEAILSSDLSVASSAARVLTQIAVYCYKEGLPAEGSPELMVALESLVIMCGVNSVQDNIKELKITLKCLVDLCLAEPNRYCSRTSRVLGSQLTSSPWRGYQTSDSQEIDVKRVIAILEALCALGGSIYSPDCVKLAMPFVIKKLKQVILYSRELNGDGGNIVEVSEPSKNIADDGTALVLLCTLICQERAGLLLNGNKLNNVWECDILSSLTAANGWVKYSIARAALRYGHHNLASKITIPLSKSVPSEWAQRWLSSLTVAAKANLLLQESPDNVDEAIGGFWRASWMSRREAVGGCAAGCTGCGACWQSAPAWLAARARSIRAAARAVDAACALCRAPPPAVSQTPPASLRDTAGRAGAATHALRAAVRDLKALDWGKLQRCALYAGKRTRTHFLIQKHIYDRLAVFIDRVLTNNYQDKQSELTLTTQDMTSTCLEEKILLSVAKEIDRISDKLFNSPDTKSGITHRHMRAVKLAAQAAYAGGVWPLGALCGVQPSLCRVSLSSPRSDLIIPHGQHLALKLDGVLLQEPARKKHKPEDREIKEVQLTVTATPHPRGNDKQCTELSSIPPVMTAVQTVGVTRDFFSAQQLVSVPSAGHYTLAVHAALVDTQGEVWLTGPYSTVTVKVHEDPQAKTNVQAARSPRF